MPTGGFAVTDVSNAAADRRRPPPVRGDFVEFSAIQTRWTDNDLYGHVNNSVYYFYFDSEINRYLIEFGGLDIHASPVIGVTAETTARFVASFAYPDDIEAGLAVAELTARSARYHIGLFASGEVSARVFGQFVHVFCDRATMRPAPMPERIRVALQRMMTPASASQT